MSLMGRLTHFGTVITWALLSVVLGMPGRAAGTDAASCDRTSKLVTYIPSTISPQWAARYKQLQAHQRDLARKLSHEHLSSAVPPGPQDLAGWARGRKAFDVMASHLVDDAEVLAAQRALKLSDSTYAGVPVLIVTPQKLLMSSDVLIYLHGGGYTMGSPRDESLAAALMASASGLRVISVGYTLAPDAKWRTVIGQVVDVYHAVLKQGYRPQNIGLFGDSAGGGLAAGATLAIRDRGLPMPGALVLWSPWTDISPSGDTYVTLKDADPSLHEGFLQASADAYAPPAEQKNPYVSPVYGDFSKGFPPTLIQGGTKELLLSDFVRLYQAIASAGGAATLDIYEGMRHVFQLTGAETPESDTAVHRSAQFFREHLGRNTTAPSEVAR